MENGFKIVRVNPEYCNYLIKFDNRVSYNEGAKELRPFVGILFVIDSCEYFAPLASPKPKHKSLKNTLDLIKIENGEFGVINFNNMIPVTKCNYEDYNLDVKSDDIREKFRIELLTNQLRWLTSNKKEVLDRANLLYYLYKNNRLPDNVRNRCCNFMLLEEKCNEYNKIHA